MAKNSNDFLLARLMMPSKPIATLTDNHLHEASNLKTNSSLSQNPTILQQSMNNFLQPSSFLSNPLTNIASAIIFQSYQQKQQQTCSPMNLSSLSVEKEPKLRANTKYARKSQSERKAAGKEVEEGASPPKRKIGRKLNFTDDVTCSPVSGMFIKSMDDTLAVEPSMDELDETAKYVEVTDEARAALAAIVNVIGDYVCQLCKMKYVDAFALARHRCPRIVHAEYRCPQCEKVFSCPANLASHRRWHRPGQKRPELVVEGIDAQQSEELQKSDETPSSPCPICFIDCPDLSAHMAQAHTNEACRLMLLQQVKLMKANKAVV